MLPADHPVGSAPVDLVRRIRRGDLEAEEELVQRYRRGVSVILYRAGADAAAIGDLSQDTFRLALEKIRRGEVREPEKLSGFVCALARNLATDHFRKASAHRLTPIRETIVSAQADPLEELLRGERAESVRRVLSEMASERDRRILFRFYIAEDEKDAICRDLGLTSLHFNRVLFRARERYRELYLETLKRTGKKPR
jgi:RNA polymerase sigma-70 factor (ECF subfamily)